MNLKSKLTQKDLDEVLRILKARDNSMNGFSHYDNSTTNIATSASASVSVVKAKQKTACDNQKENVAVDLDSTLVVADNSSSNLNTSC